MRNSKERFSDRVQDYVRYRPGYPVDLVPLLARECALTPDSIVADVGSGTGILTRLLLEYGCRVFGVEPNADMRAAAEELLSEFERFESIDGSAEATTLRDASADLVVAGQAFHWFDRPAARREFARILRPDGWVVLVWNIRRVDASPFMTEYERLLRTYGTDYEQVSHHGVDEPQLDEFFGANDCGRAVLANAQSFDYEGLEGRLLSSSYVPGRGTPGADAMLAALRALYDEHRESGRVVFTYETKVYFGRVS